jgi:hypothetical protein
VCPRARGAGCGWAVEFSGMDRPRIEFFHAVDGTSIAWSVHDSGYPLVRVGMFMTHLSWVEDVTPAHTGSPSSRPLRACRHGPLRLPRALPPHRLEHSCRSASRLLPRGLNVSPPSESYLLLLVGREPALLRGLDEQTA